MPNINLKGKKVIVGGGIAGISAAMKLARAGYSVVLFEKNVIGSGASGINPGRMGHGFHYTDPETAKRYLRESIATQRNFPGYLVGQDLPWKHPLRHGRYFITKDSNPPAETVLKTYAAIKEEYLRLVEEDPRNKVFGPPEDFFRILEPKEYADQVNVELVDVGVETCEHLFRIIAFLDDFNRDLQHEENIEVIQYAKVLNVSKNTTDPKFPPFELTVEHEGLIKHYYTDTIINSTWYNIEAINSGLGIPYSDGERTNRLKSILIVKLSEEINELPSMFFCMGQHCMFSNLGNGTGMITYAPITNMEVSSALTITESMRYYLEDQVTHEERLDIGTRMLEGARKYIPSLRHASVVEVRFGIVQTKGDLKDLSALKDPKHPFHIRDYDGIRIHRIGDGLVVNNPAIKLFYFLHNGQEVLKAVQAHERELMNQQQDVTLSPQIGPQYSCTDSMTQLQFTIPVSPIQSALSTNGLETKRHVCTSSLPPGLANSPGEETDFSPFGTEDEREEREDSEQLPSGSDSDKRTQSKILSTSTLLLAGSMFNRGKRGQHRGRTASEQNQGENPHMSLSS